MPLLLLPAPRQAGKACSASCVLFSYSSKSNFDLTAERFACTFFKTCNFWYQHKSLTIPEAIRHPTRETQEHRVTNSHFAAARSVYGCSCRMCDFLGRMVLLKETATIKFLCWCWLWFAKRRDLVTFWRCKHTHRGLSGPPLLKNSGVVHLQLFLLLQSQEGRACDVLRFVF